MKKIKLLSVILSLLMMMSLFMVSCSKSEEERIKEQLAGEWSTVYETLWRGTCICTYRFTEDGFYTLTYDYSEDPSGGVYYGTYIITDFKIMLYRDGSSAGYMEFDYAGDSIHMLTEYYSDGRGGRVYVKDLWG